jgi:undecaprenyl diphosphate synthase
MSEKTPTSIGFIMDGNRRWAKDKNLPTIKGHQQGFAVFKEAVRFLREREIAHGVFYAFSTENWNRSKAEVEYLLKLFKQAITELEEQIQTEKPVKVRFIGERTDFSDELQAEMNRIEAKNETYKDATTTVWLALSYGGRPEIISAVNQAIENGKPVTEATFKELLWTADLPDPDIIVRTSGEQRLSNFLTWSSAYSELYFIKKHWPALTADDFEDILREYAQRERRLGH